MEALYFRYAPAIRTLSKSVDRMVGTHTTIAEYAPAPDGPWQVVPPTGPVHEAYKTFLYQDEMWRLVPYRPEA